MQAQIGTRLPMRQRGNAVQLTGIQRELAYSPNQHAENDRLILEQTAEELRRKGCSVRLITEEEVGRTPITSPVVFSMCQGARANETLGALEHAGSLVINSPFAIRRCYRENLYAFLEGGWEILPTTLLVRPSDRAAFARAFAHVAREGGLWIKRGDVHATQTGDVVRVRGALEGVAVLEDFVARGIRTAAVQAHVEGTVVKFYGVVGTGFFRYYTERDFKICPVAFGAARPAIERLVSTLGLEVYGGDAVLTPEGRIFVIDVNDWPSFAYYRAEAAEAISTHILGRAAAFLGSKAASASLAHAPWRTERRAPR
jgi:hypothetical protein